MNKKIIKIGIIGGFGPLASASFVETIYLSFLGNEALQQHYHPPYVYLHSEPLTSQATALMSVAHSEVELLTKLEKNIGLLVVQEINYLVICCLTAHALLPQLRPNYQNKISSLVTLILEYILAHQSKFVILGASSALESRVLESHPLWLKAVPYITFLEERQQQQLNKIIHAVKKNQIDSQILNHFLELHHQFPQHQLIIACAELHVLHKKLQPLYPKIARDLYDPLFHITEIIWGETL